MEYFIILNAFGVYILSVIIFVLTFDSIYFVDVRVVDKRLISLYVCNLGNTNFTANVPLLLSGDGGFTRIFINI